MTPFGCADLTQQTVHMTQRMVCTWFCGARVTAGALPGPESATRIALLRWPPPLSPVRVPASLARRLSALYRAHLRDVVAPLVRVLGSFESAEDVVEGAFAEALVRWEREGQPDKPVAWLRTVARNRGLDRLRRGARWEEKAGLLAHSADSQAPAPADPDTLEDDLLRLIFTFCHPALSAEARLALTLHTVCGLTTDELARAFLVPGPSGGRVARCAVERRPVVPPAGPRHGRERVVALSLGEGAVGRADSPPKRRALVARVSRWSYLPAAARGGSLSSSWRRSSRETRSAGSSSARMDSAWASST